MNVVDETQAQPGTPAMGMKLVKIDEASFAVQVAVAGPPGQPPRQKSYSIAGPPITDQQAAALALRWLTGSGFQATSRFDHGHKK